MAIKLNAIQRRVLGVLIEKSMTTPGSYPLTLNSIVTGCNQLSCRQPVMQLAEGEVAAALHELQKWQLASQAPPDRNARSNRFVHTVEPRFGWNPQERALMAEMLLRGPQTLGELKGNASRMTPIGDLNYAGELLLDLGRREPPFVRELARQPGKSTTRFDHCLYPDDEPREAGVAVMTMPAVTQPATMPPSGLEARVAHLEADLAALREELHTLQKRVDPQVSQNTA